MQLTINQPSGWISASLFKPFLLIGVAGISSVALYTPLSSQATELKSKLNKATVEPLSPFSDKLTKGSEKLFNQLAEWAKTGANGTDKVKEWINEAARGNVSDGAKQIYVTLKHWAEKVYEFLKSLFTEDAWNRVKENIKMLGNILNLFKNLMKAELNGKNSILSELVGGLGTDEAGQLISTLGEMAQNNPDLLENMDEEVIKEIGNALKGDKEEAQKILQEFAKEENKEKTVEDLKNALEPAALIGQIEAAIDKAKKIQATEGDLNGEKRKEAQEVFDELKTLSGKLDDLIQKAQKAQKAK